MPPFEPARCSALPGARATKKVLITGADGLIGGILRTRLAGDYELRLLSRKPMDEPSHVGDIADYEVIRPAFDGIDAVVHLAGAAEVESSWEEVLGSNIIGTRNVFEAARDAGVAQVVYASSTHAVAMHERDAAPQVYEPGDPRVFDERVELRPDSLYGTSKAFGELIGRLYAERHGLRVICIRVGWVGDGQLPDGGRRRAAVLCLSHEDCARLFRAALEADEVRFAIVYGTSDNARQVWDLSGARRLLGYDPQDGVR